MRTILTALILIFGLSASAQSKVQHLFCTTGAYYERFTATLDPSSFDAKSGLFRVVDAHITDNYATARLHCTGHRLEEIACVGFWFDSSNEIVEVKTSKKDGVLGASYRPLVGSYQQTPGPWECTVN